MPPAAIVAAGGSGDRARAAGPGEPKQFRLLAGRPLVTWCIATLAEVCDPLVIAVPPGSLDRARDLVGIHGKTELVFVEGGATRQASVANALARVESPQVVVHDAVRPFVARDLVERVVEALDRADAAIAAVPSDDTLKTGSDGEVVATIDRRGIWRVQTPQAFHTETLRGAHRRAIDEGFVGTDDAQLVERSGGRVAIVEGARTNIKVTFPEDLEIAEAIARARPRP